MINKFLILFWALGLSAISLADDTEIYGTAGPTANNKHVNPNVLFVMDTSGSMDYYVLGTKPVFDSTATNYGNDYDDDKFYGYLSQNKNKGYSNFNTEASSDCPTALATMRVTGFVQGDFEQSNRVGRSLSQNNSKEITCNAGDTITMYSGKYMNWHHNNGLVVNQKRLTIVVGVVKALTESLSDINLGMMRFDQGIGGSADANYSGGYVDVPISDIATSGPLIRTALDSYQGQGGTPLTEVMYEAKLYYNGETWEYGSDSGPKTSALTSRKSDETTYKSPISAECQKNHIILFTDGEASVDGEANTSIHTLIADDDHTGIKEADLSKSCSGDGGCLDELTYNLRNQQYTYTDPDDTTKSFTNSLGITTYTIGGFGLTSAAADLTAAAQRGGGSFYEANNTAGLSEVLSKIFLDILSVDTTFTAPAVSVNAFNASQHSNELFYALFKPNDKIKWGGNLKKYNFNAADEIIEDAKSAPAIDDLTGYFKKGTFDFWNATTNQTLSYPDGVDVTDGGMANLLTSPSSRNIFSDLSDDNMQPFSSVASYTTFGMATDSASFTGTDEFKWAQGFDTKNTDIASRTNSRKQIGDPLHSEPVIVTYRNLGTPDAPIADSVIFFGTNEGFIHAVNTSSGQEEFSFIPKELHPIQKTYFDNTLATDKKPYGMDGLITTWLYDLNSNGVIYGAGAGSALESQTVNGVTKTEHAYLYSGMRRGGNSYYGLDISKRSDPEMLFKITGGPTSTGGTAGFEKLGQTWSRMTVAKVKFNKVSKHVLFFTGGYDTNQDGNTTRQDDSIGNAIYMVDATDGSLLWSASGDSGESLTINEMQNSMPASVAAIDITGDDHINYLFAADTAGRVFRIDIDQDNSGAADFATGGMIAQVGGDTTTDNLRFYNKPNVALVKDKQLGDHLTISIGSGHRAHPINTVDVTNRFFVIKDRHPYQAPSTYSVITEAADNTIGAVGIDAHKLYNATDLMTLGKSAYTSNMQKIMATGGGWFVDIPATGEKALAESTTHAGVIIFTTFSPSTGTLSSSCGADAGVGRIYVLDQKTAMPIVDLDNDGTLDAVKTLTHSGIAPRPIVIYGKDSHNKDTRTIAVGTELIKFEKPGGTGGAGEVNICDENSCNVTPVYWHQNEN